MGLGHFSVARPSDVCSPPSARASGWRGRGSSCACAGVRRRFLAADAFAAAIWAAYASLLGYFGGNAFTESLWKPLLAAAVVGLTIAIATEVARRVAAA